MRPETLRISRSVALSALVTGATTLLLLALRHWLSEAHIGLLYELNVVLAACVAGMEGALVGALLSFFAWNFFFIPPFYTLSIADPRHFILLIVFLFVALIVGHITARLRTREREARERERELEALYRSSIAVGSEIKAPHVCEILVHQIMLSSSAQGCVIARPVAPFDPFASAGASAAFFSAAGQDFAAQAVSSCSVVDTRTVALSHEPPAVFLPLCLGARVLGVMYATPGDGSTFSTAQQRLLDAFGRLVAAALERSRLLDEAAELSARQKSETLRAVLFSSLSHNLKTPLASLAAAIGSLRQRAIAKDEEKLKGVATLMDADIQRLTQHIDKLLHLAALESGEWNPRKDHYELAEIVATATRHLREEEYQRLSIHGSSRGETAFVDLVQVSQVLHHLLENALAYSPAGSRIDVALAGTARGLELRVDDAGPGIPAAEQERLFQKRGETALADHPAGLGLAICREIVNYHGGTIRVGKSPLGGASVQVQLPTNGGDGTS